MNSCVDCYVAKSPPVKSTGFTSTDVGLALGGLGYAPVLLLAFTWLVFEGPSRMRKIAIYVCGLLHILQRLVFYLEQSGKINRLRIGPRCYLWEYLSSIHIQTFFLVCSALN